MRRWLLDVTRRPVVVQEVPEIVELPGPLRAERSARTVTHLTRRREAMEVPRVGSPRDRVGAHFGHRA